MEENYSIRKELMDLLICFAICGACVLVIYFTGGIHYAVNDDIAMRDIVSGVRSGSPDGHVIYMKYPLGWFISCLYKYISYDIDWYGSFLIMLIISSAALIVYRIKQNVKSIALKICLYILNCYIFLQHVFFIQWTLCATFCGSVGIFFYVTIVDKNKKSRWLQKGISIMLLLLCYLVRDKVFYVVMALGTGLIIVKEYADKNNIKKAIYSCVVYLGILWAVIFSMNIVHKVAYRSEEWRLYLEFNRARSLLYDYHTIPEYEANIDFYIEQNISRHTYNNLKNYAFIYDPNINTETINEIIEYAETQNSISNNTIRDTFNIMKKYILGEKYLVLHFFLLLLIFSVFGMSRKDKKWLCLMCVAEIVIWGGIVVYLACKGRFPERIAYMTSITFLLMFGALFIYLSTGKASRKIEKVMYVCITCIGLLFCVGKYNQLSDESILVNQHNFTYDQIKEYINEHNDNLYLLPSNTFAKYTDKYTFLRAKYEGMYLTTGGWLSRSPLIDKKLQIMGMCNVPADFIGSDHFFIMNWDDRGISYIVSSIEENIGCSIDEDVIDFIETSEGTMNVYCIR